MKENMSKKANHTLQEILNEFLNVEEAIQAIVILTDILKEHYDRDSEKELHNLMLIIYKNIKNVSLEMREPIRNLDKFLLEAHVVQL